MASLRGRVSGPLPLLQVEGASRYGGAAAPHLASFLVFLVSAPFGAALSKRLPAVRPEAAPDPYLFAAAPKYVSGFGLSGRTAALSAHAFAVGSSPVGALRALLPFAAARTYVGGFTLSAPFGAGRTWTA